MCSAVLVCLQSSSFVHFKLIIPILRGTVFLSQGGHLFGSNFVGSCCATSFGLPQLVLDELFKYDRVINSDYFS